MEAFSWRDDFGDDLTPESIRDMFSPASEYRVSEYNYPAGEVINGSMIAGKCFVFRGACSYKYLHDEIYLKSGNWAELPAGSYRLIIGSESDVQLALVWPIPKTGVS